MSDLGEYFFIESILILFISFFRHPRDWQYSLLETKLGYCLWNNS